MTAPALTATNLTQPRRLFVVAILAALAVLIWGGYGHHWSFTGFSDNDTLWDWLKLLLLPISLAALPLWLRSHRRMDRTRHILYLALIAGFAALIAVGYLLPLKWTGFTGNTLWDWLQLLVLPIVISTVNFWRTERTIEARHRIGASAMAAAFATFVTCAYLLPLGWTGFSGNTLWDWIQLLFVPMLLPLLVVPAVTEWINAGVAEEEAEEDAETEQSESPRLDAADSTTAASHACTMCGCAPAIR
jgi:hypothetical protein